VNRYVIADAPDSYERLETLGRLGRPAIVELLQRAGARPGMRCLDLGCGAGAMTLELARMVGPAGRVTGVDADAGVLQLARAKAEREGLGNVELVAGDVFAAPVATAYDFVSCRLLLQHLDRPVELLRHAWSAVAPGGVIAVEDADFDGLFCDPPNDGFEFFRRVYPRLLAARGGDGAIGRKLHRHFAAAGIPAPQMTMYQPAHVRGEGKRLILWTLQATAEAIAAERNASAEEIDAAVASLAEFTASDGTLVSQPRHFQLWARRPID
jgi:ubiquinone/menaquinone biosynthesis C-methylase UbiE